MKGDATKKNSILIFIFLIPFFACIAIFVVLLSFMERNIRETQQLNFENLVIRLESDCDGLMRDASSLSLKQYYRKAYATNEFTSFEDETFYFLREYLGDVKSKYPFAERVVCILPGGFFVSNENADKNDFIFADIPQYDVGEEEFISSFSTNTVLKIRVYGGNFAIAYLNITAQSCDVRLAIFIDGTMFESYARSLCDFRRGGGFYIADESDVLLHGANEGEKFVTGSNLKSSVYHCLTSASGKTDITYYFYMSEYNYAPIKGLVWGISIPCILIAVFIGISLLLSTVKKRYIPLYELRRKINKRTIGNAEDMTDEEFRIRLDEILQSDSKIEEAVPTRALDKRQLINSLFSRLIKNLPLPENLQDICARYELDLENKKFNVAILESRTFSEIVHELEYDKLIAEKEKLYNARITLLKKHFAQFAGVYVVEEEEFSVIVLASEKTLTDEEITERIKTSAKNYQAEANKEFKLDATFSISMPVADIQKLNKAYKQARGVKDYAYLMGTENEIVVYSQIYGSKKLSPDLLIYKDLRDSIRLKEWKKAYDQILKIIDSEMTGIDSHELMIKLYSFVDRINTELVMATDYYQNDFVARLDVTNRLTSVRSVKEFRKTVGEIFGELMNYREGEEEGQNAWIPKVQEYIRKHYSDSELTVSFLADRFHFSLSYFSRVHKQETGYGVNEYIQEVRLDEAKVLLKQNKPVGEVALAVGYLDSRSLIRAFKLAFGDTPAQFKKKQ